MIPELILKSEFEKCLKVLVIFEILRIPIHEDPNSLQKNRFFYQNKQ